MFLIWTTCNLSQIYQTKQYFSLLLQVHMLLGKNSMNSNIKPASRKRFRNIRIDQILSYRLPAAGIMSILHRISGAGLFLVLPFLIYLLQLSLDSETAYSKISILLSNPLIFFIMSGVIWSIIHHFFAGIRHLLLDMHLGLSNKSAGRWGVLIISVSVALAFIFSLGMFDIVYS